MHAAPDLSCPVCSFIPTFRLAFFFVEQTEDKCLQKQTTTCGPGEKNKLWADCSGCQEIHNYIQYWNKHYNTEQFFVQVANIVT